MMRRQWLRVLAAPVAACLVLDATGRLLRAQNTGALDAGENHNSAAFRAFLARHGPAGR